jgi:hypothetical protein
MSRNVLIVLAAFGKPAGLAAQDEPFLGTWELNLAASSIIRGAPPRVETICEYRRTGRLQKFVGRRRRKVDERGNPSLQLRWKCPPDRRIRSSGAFLQTHRPEHDRAEYPKERNDHRSPADQALQGRQDDDVYCERHDRRRTEACERYPRLLEEVAGVHPERQGKDRL